MFGKRVLITRPAHQAGDLAARLRAMGAHPILAPAIAIGPPDDPAAARAAAVRVRDYAWVVFTSRNAVDAFFAALGELGRDASALGDTRVVAIGPKTAAALAARGVHADAVPVAHVNEAVAAELLERTQPGDRILLYRAQEAREVIPAALCEYGRTVDVVAAYATRAVDDPGMAAKAHAADIVTFTSAGTVRAFVHNVPDAAAALAAKTVAAIGPITARAARAAGIRVDVIPAAFTADALIDALAAAVNTA